MPGIWPHWPPGWVDPTSGRSAPITTNRVHRRSMRAISRSSPASSVRLAADPGARRSPQEGQFARQALHAGAHAVEVDAAAEGAAACVAPIPSDVVDAGRAHAVHEAAQEPAARVEELDPYGHALP